MSKWWYVRVENRKRWGFIKTYPAEDCEVRFWLIQQGASVPVTPDGYKGRWQVESSIEETGSKMTLRVGVPNSIPVVRISSRDESLPRLSAYTAYITETHYFTNDEPSFFTLDPGKYTMLLELSTGASTWMKASLSLDVPREGLEGFELKLSDKKEPKKQSITKKQIHSLDS